MESAIRGTCCTSQNHFSRLFGSQSHKTFSSPTDNPWMWRSVTGLLTVRRKCIWFWSLEFGVVVLLRE